MVARLHGSKFACLLLIAILILTGCSSQKTVPTNQPTPAVTKPSVDMTPAIRTATWEAYGKVLQEVGESKFPVDPVMAKQRLTGKENQFLIIDLRSAQDYAQRHLKGAVNLSVVGLAENIGSLPKNKTLLLYCYTGQSSALAMVPLKAFGYEAIFINGGFGMMEKAGFVMDTKGATFSPVKNDSPTDTQRSAVLEGIRANLLSVARQHMVKTLVVADSEVQQLVEGSPDKFAFVDLRPREDYAKGHIKGAISAPLAELRTRITDLPKEKRLILCCKSGQLAAMTTAPLTAEGFKIISLCAGVSQAEKGALPWGK